MIEKLYETPMTDYMIRLCRASEDVLNSVSSLDAAVCLYKVSGVDLRAIVLEKREWLAYCRSYKG